MSKFFELKKLVWAPLFLAIPAFAQLKRGPIPHAAYVPGELIVKFRGGLSSAGQLQTLGIRGHRRKRTMGGDGRMARVSLSPNESVESALDAYRDDPTVEYVEPNYILRLTSLPNDPQFANQWGLRNTGQTFSVSGLQGSVMSPTTGTAGKDMDLADAWNVSGASDCSSVPVAVIDSGVQYAHEDLAANMWNGGASFPHHGYSTVDPNGTDPIDWNGHGTHVASIIGAVGNNGIGGTGVCQKANIMAVRAADRTGSLTAADAVEAVDWARLHGARVLNMSFASSDKITSLDDAISNAASAGILVVAAAGNEKTDNDLTTPSYPCDYALDNVICVAALDSKYALAEFSNYGAKSVDVGAPGVNIAGAWAGDSVVDTFSIGTWTLGAGWGMRNMTDTATGELVPVLSNPANWGAAGASNYAGNFTSTAWKFFAQSGAGSMSLNVDTVIDVDLASGDSLKMAIKAGNNDPFGGGGTVVANYSGVSTAEAVGGSIQSFNNTDFSIGFQMQSVGTGAKKKGAGIYSFALTRLVSATDGYRAESGTSMATPFVSGLAAMLFAYNPNYTYSDVAESIKNGGDAVDSLSGKTTTGRAVNAMGSLSYIRPPQGVTASVD